MFWASKVSGWVFSHFVQNWPSVGANSVCFGAISLSLTHTHAHTLSLSFANIHSVIIAVVDNYVLRHLQSNIFFYLLLCVNVCCLCLLPLKKYTKNYKHSKNPYTYKIHSILVKGLDEEYFTDRTSINYIEDFM